MTTVVVAGSSSRAGKTALAETVLRALPGAAAVKFTTTDDVFEKCPRGTTCIVCDIDVPFKIVRDEATLAQADTDTARLRKTTSGPVLWTIARRSVAEQAWRATERFLEGAAGTPAVADRVIEGSTVASICAPDFTFFVIHPFLSPARWKDGSRELMGRADCVVINRAATEPRDPGPEVLAAIRESNPRDLRIADVVSPFETWASDLEPRLKRG